jgi:hypothetical protein
LWEGCEWDLGTVQGEPGALWWALWLALSLVPGLALVEVVGRDGEGRARTVGGEAGDPEGR